MTKSTHTTEYKNLVAILEDARRKSGLTQQQLAARLNKPQSYVAKVEGAERRIDVVEFIALARALGVEPGCCSGGWWRGCEAVAGIGANA